jgi:hypothetical protein
MAESAPLFVRAARAIEFARNHNLLDVTSWTRCGLMRGESSVNFAQHCGAYNPYNRNFAAFRCDWHRSQGQSQHDYTASGLFLLSLQLLGDKVDWNSSLLVPTLARQQLTCHWIELDPCKCPVFLLHELVYNDGQTNSKLQQHQYESQVILNANNDELRFETV